MKVLKIIETCIKDSTYYRLFMNNTEEILINTTKSYFTGLTAVYNAYREKNVSKF